MSNTDTAPTPVPARPTEASRHTLADDNSLNARLRDGNKAALFAALAAAGITHVAVSFDGYADEGQIQSIDARTGEDAVELPAANVTIAVVEWGQPEAAARNMTVSEAVERLAYDYLGDTHAGWQDGDGAYGEFVFDVGAGTITLDHNDRYTAVDSYSHEF